MTGILFSTAQEAGPFLERYERGRFDGLTEGDTVEDGKVLVSLTGIGKIKATLRTERLLQKHRPKQLIQAGICTALNDGFELGQCIAIHQVFEGDRIEMAAPTYPRMPLETPFEDLPTATLVTQDHTPRSDNEQGYWQRIADLSDMVGYPVAFVSATHGIPCHIVKVVAGYTGKQDPQLRRTRAHAHQALADFLLAELAKS